MNIEVLSSSNKTIEIVRQSNTSLVSQGVPLGGVTQIVQGGTATGVTFLNGLQQTILLTGSSGILVTVDGQTIVITQTGDSSSSISGYLQAQINNLNNNTGSYYLNSNLQQYSTSGNLFNTGSLLDNKINVLSGNSVLLFGDQTVNGTKTFNTGINVSGNGVDFYNQSNPTWREGRVFYDNEEKTLAYYNDNNGITVNLGQELLVRAVNKSNNTIYNGNAVYISGAQGNRPAIYPAIARDLSADRIVGIATHDINHNNNGYVTTKGIVHELDLSQFNEGDTLYLSATTTGGLTNIIPNPPNHLIKVGIVLNNSSTVGALLVDPSHIDSNLKYLHDVFIPNPQDNDLLSYDQTSGFWVNKPNFSGVLQSEINSINNNTGNFYTKDNPYQYIRSGDVSSVYSTISNLQTTGANLQSQINTINNNTGLFYLKSNPQNYATSGNLQSTGQTLLTEINSLKSETGKYYIANNSGYLNSLSGLSTGYVQEISGVLNTSINNVSGVLQTQINGINVSNYYLNSNPSGFLNTLSGLSTGYVISISGLLSNRIELTGQTLLNLISSSAAGVATLNGLSGIVNINGLGSIFVTTNGQNIYISGNSGDFATVSNLQLTGSNLQAQINSINNGTGNFISSSQTGQFYPVSNPQQYVNSGNLYATGSNLDSKINSLSGYSNNNFYFNSNPSGFLNTLSGLSVSYVSGVSGNLQSSINTVSTNLQSTGETLNSRINSLSGYSDGQFATIVNLQNTGSNLQSQVNNLTNQTGRYYLNSNPSGYLTGFNSGIYITTGQTGQFYPVSNPQNYATSGNLSSTGSFLQNQISAINAGTGSFISTSQTGQFYPASNPQNYATSGNLSATGSFLQSQISAISAGTGSFISTSQTGQFYPASNPQNYATSGNLNATGSFLQSQISAISAGTGSFISTSQTGQFYPASNPQAYATSGNLTNSGVALNDKINSLSGYSNNTFATISSLVNTGNNLQTQITTLNSNTGNYYLNSNPYQYVTSGDLSQTGSALNTKINTLSGYVDSNLLYLTVTGSNRILSANLTGIGGAQVILSGNNILISGGASGPAGNTTNNYFINSGSGLFVFRTYISNGVDKQFITYPTTLDYNPLILNSVRNDVSETLVSCQISGAVNTGYWAIFSNTINNTGYYLDTIACNSTGTGLATTVIVNNINGGSVSVSNIGNGFGIYSGTVSNDIKLFSVSGTNGITVSNQGNYIQLELSFSTGQFYPASNPQNYATSGNLNATGSFLQSQISAISAGTGSFISTNQTGQFYAASNPQNYATSGNLNATGSFLQSQISAISAGTGSFISTSQTGQFYAASNPQNYATSGNLNATGSFLQSQISAISAGTGSFISTSQTGQFYPASNPQNYATSGNLNATGSFLQSQISAISAGTGSFISTNQTGQFYAASNPQNYATSGNLNATGSFLQSQISAISAGTGSFISTSQTGQFYAASNPQNYATSGNLNATGSFLQSQISAISAGTGSFISTSQTGQFYPASNPQNYATSGNLNATGSFLQSQISAISAGTGSFISTNQTGQFYAASNPQNYATSGNLNATGSFLQSQISAISAGTGSFISTSQTGQFYAASNPQNYATSGNLNATGSFLQSQISAISAGTGSFISTNQTGQFYPTSNPQGYMRSGDATSSGPQVTGISVTGSTTITGLVNFLAGSNVTLLRSNNTITISSVGGTGSSSSSIPNTITGNGLTNYIPKFTNESGIINSNIFVNDTYVGINNLSPQSELDISGTIRILNNSTTSSIYASGNLDHYQEINIRNLSTGFNASSDLVVTNDIGTDTTNYVDLGINSSKYTGLFVGNSGDGYLYSNGGDFYIGNVVSGKKLYFFADHPVYSGSMATVTLNNDEVGINNINPQFALDVVGSGNFTQGVGVSYLSLNKSVNTPLPIASGQTSLYFEDQAKRSILTYANERGIGKNIQNTLFAENINIFSPNTTTSMTVYGTTATTVGTLSHPTTFTDLTRDGYATNFATAVASSSPAGMMSAASQFFLTSGVTGLGAGFYFAAQFSFPDHSGLYAQATGTTTGIRFFAGMTDTTTTALTLAAPYPSAALLGFQFLRSSGISGRFDGDFKFVAKDNGAAAPFYVQNTNCPFNSGTPYIAYVYGRSDYRNGVHWAIETPTQVYSGDFTGAYTSLPLVSSAAQRMLRPHLGMVNLGTVARNFKSKGLYCETV